MQQITQDISILGKLYSLKCTPESKSTLLLAEKRINEMVNKIRKSGLETDAVLVMCCLQLFEESFHAIKQNETLEQALKEALALVDKIEKDAQSIV